MLGTCIDRWWVLQGSNLRPTACKAVALPAELNTREAAYLTRGLPRVNANGGPSPGLDSPPAGYAMVGATGIEPVTPAV